MDASHFFSKAGSELGGHSLIHLRCLKSDQGWMLGSIFFSSIVVIESNALTNVVVQAGAVATFKRCI